MRIAIIGIRGIPVPYSTFETFAQTLGTELIKRNHRVSVYCRSSYVKKATHFNGIKRIVFPSIETKQLGTFTHSFISTLHATFFGRYDVILYLGVANAIFTVFPRLFGIKTMIHINGLDWERVKWSNFAKAYLRFSLFLTTIFPNVVISDNKFVCTYYKNRYKKKIENIPYGYYIPNITSSGSLLKKYKVQQKEYIVWVGRLVPDNNLEELLHTFKTVNTDMKCLIIGDDYYNKAYKKHVYKIIALDKRVIRTGFIKHEDVLTLVANARGYIETKRNGGTQMALIEAMGTGVPIISNNSIEHKNVLGKAAMYYSPQKIDQLSVILTKLCVRRHNQFLSVGNKAKERVRKKYRWEKVVTLYERLFLNALHYNATQKEDRYSI